MTSQVSGRSSKTSKLALYGAPCCAVFLGSLTGCSGFEALQPSDTVILSVTNPNPLFAVGTPTNVRPMPLPQLPPGTVVHGVKLSSTPQVVSSTANPVSDITVPPYRSVGRSQFTFPSTQPGWANFCTAQLIGDGTVLLTAGHCAWDHDSASWVRTQTFYLQYSGNSSAQVNDWECAAVYSGWTKQSQDRYVYDYAMYKLRGTPGPGLDLQIDVGATANVDSVGYAINYDLEHMYHSVGTKNGSNPSRMDNPMSHGASGGAWLLNGKVIALNSFGVSSDPSHMYGPVLTGDTLALYNFVHNNCHDPSQPHALYSGTKSEPQAGKRRRLVITPETETPSLGAVIAISSTNASCGARGDALELWNQSRRRREVTVQPTSPNISDTAGRPNPKVVVVGAGEHLLLACRNSSKRALTSAAQPYQTYRILADRADTPKRRPARNGALLAALPAQLRDVSDCIPVCTSVTTDSCLVLGKGFIAAFAPLAELLDATQASGGKPDGTIISKAEVINSFGGNPAATEDPCHRSDITKVGTAVENSSLTCRLEVPDPADQTFGVRLHMPAVSIATPTAWDGTLAAAMPTPVLYFKDRNTAPVIDFMGTDAKANNETFGGDVSGVARISKKELVVATSNACIRGYYAH